MRQVLIGHLCQRDLSDIQLLALDQLQQQIERAFEGWELESVVYSFGKHRLAAMLLWLQQRYFPCFSRPLWFRPLWAKPVTPQNGVESFALTPIANQLVNRPAMIGQVGRHCGRPSQGRMPMTKIVHAAGPEQGRFQALTRTRRCPG